MSVMTKKLRCPLCGTPNSSSAERCSVCTRPLVDAALASQRVYDETLWATTVATKGSKKSVSLSFVLGCVLVALVIANYFFLKQGPDWAHEPRSVVPGETWRSFDTQRGVSVDLPGSPVTATAPLTGVESSTATVWVDRSWEAVRDNFTNSKVAEDNAVAKFHAAIVVAASSSSAAAPSLDELARTLSPNLTLAPAATAPANAGADELAWSWQAAATGFPLPNTEGVAYGRSIQRGDVRLSIVTVVASPDDAKLLDELLTRVDWKN